MTNSKKPVSPTAGAAAVLSTVSGPSASAPLNKGLAAKVPRLAALADKAAAIEALAAAMPNNPNKAGEHGAPARSPEPGATREALAQSALGSSISETTPSPKVGDGVPPSGVNPLAASLDRVRVDSSEQALTTNQGVPIADNQNSLKIGLRGPTAMEDFILREKITHFDHERIPERVVHARGSAAHGYFECYKELSDLTRAAPFAQDGKRTPVFVRFSTVAGERGSADTVRDVRGFAVKMYTDEGNWDLVGNNIPVFFIQDAMKFPDLVHAVKPEAHHAMPQASSAHDTFWDFVSLMPESTHMLMWLMSDRAIPRSYRTMQGFGVHTFRLVNADGAAVFCKFHWMPLAGTHSLVWDEAAKITGADADFHRRDLWEAIEAGAYPEWELQLQLFTEEQAGQFAFDVLDPTKLVPEELVPLMAVGKLTLNRNPDNFFAETEQVAFCTAHVVPGIDFSNDPLLQGRNHSYIDTQISRLGGANFHELPINAPLAQVHNNQRDGMHRQAVHRGRANYEPNSLAGGCPFQAGLQGFVSFPQATEGDKMRGKPEKFAEHYSQARLFWISQSAVEQNHIANAFRFELTRVQTPAVRMRVVSMLANVDAGLAARIAHGIGIDMPAPMPLALSLPGTLPGSSAPLQASPSLSLLHRPGATGISTRRVAILISAGADGALVRASYAALLADGAVPRLLGSQLGKVRAREGASLNVEISFEATAPVLYDALIIADGNDAAAHLDAHALDFVREQYRHCKPILVLGSASAMLAKAGISTTLADGSPDPAIIHAGSDALQGIAAFKVLLAGHRSFARESDPPAV